MVFANKLFFGAIALSVATVPVGYYVFLYDREPELAAASTDANIPIALGVPAIAIGAGGRGGDAHTPGEWYDNTDGPLGIVRAMTILATAAELV